MFIPRTYTVESVTSGHPDKVCDQISDAILDECLKQDPLSRVAVETFGSHGLLVLGGEITSNAEVDYEAVAKRVYADIGYTDELKIVVNIVKQSPDIAQGVNTGGAGDQGIMYGYATDETAEFLPLGVVLAHKLAKGLEDLRRNSVLPWLRPDGKTQVTIQDGKVKTVLISAQHSEDVENGQIKTALIENLIKPVFNDIPTFSRMLECREGEGLEILVNPTGKFVKGGFEADTGLTGRKIMVDTYGGLIPHGGGCFSGKDATKVDRSGAYMARHVAKEIVAQGKAKQCLVSVAYAIGRAEPVMVQALNEKGADISALALSYDWRPNAIISLLSLRQPGFRARCCYGHF